MKEVIVQMAQAIEKELGLGNDVIIKKTNKGIKVQALKVKTIKNERCFE
ncbi:hypothetical protein [Clostridium sp.]